ncbi:MAG TPA: MFS transporter [Mycobacteriales bacterium]|nr:MFS transporter [Mycobacteriales bacterium]
MFAAYRRVFRTRGFTLPYLLGIVVTLALGSVGLGLLLTVKDRTGSLGTAGIVAGAFGLGNAFGLFAQGRLIDRYGQPRILVPAALGCGAGLVATVLSGPAAPVTALLAGAAFPATISSMRVLTTALVADHTVRISAYALLGVSFSLAAVAGPLIVSAAVLVADPAVAVVLAAILIGAGGTAFACTPAARLWRAPRPDPHQPATGLLNAGMVTLLLANSFTGFAAGIGSVALPAAVLAHGPAALTGVGFAVSAAGDVIGGLGYGAIGWSPRRSAQLAMVLAVDAVFGWAIAAASGVLVALLVLLFVSSVLLAVGPIASSALLDTVAPRQALTTAYTAIVGCGLIAGAIGNAVGGAVAERHGAGAAYGLAALAVTVAAAWVTARLRSLHGVPEAGPGTP